MDSPRLRLTWAAAVAAVSLGATVALASTGAHEPAAAQGARSAAAMTPRHLQQVAERVARLQRSDGAAVPGVSESDLRTLETMTLGSEHAAEHASNRAADRAGPAEQRARYRAAEAPVKAAAVTDPAQVGKWETPFDIPTFGIHAAVLPTGKVLYFSYQTFAQGGDAERNTTQAWLWDPTKGTGAASFTHVDPPANLRGNGKPENIWCAGHTFTSDGRLVVFGGNLSLPTSTSDYKGLDRVFTFDPFTEKWTTQPSMRHGRWYPSGVRLADGTIPILSGLTEVGDSQLNKQIELFTPSASMSGQGTVDLIGETRTDPDDESKPPTGDYYPHMFSMASGRMLVAGPENTRDTWFMNSHTRSSLSWTDAANMDTYRLWGNAIPIATDATGPHKVLALGGTDYFDTLSIPLASSELFNEDTVNPDTQQRSGSWAAAPALNIGRAHANAVLLPDGSAVEVGGGIGSNTQTKDDPNGGQYTSNANQRQIELRDPVTGKWTLGPAQQYPRAYHSTAVLLPDGRVVSAGDDRLAKRDESDTAEVYEPPYLHKGGTRPVIDSAPSATPLGSSFGVQSTSDVASAALVAPGATTHAVDMNQRYVPLQVTRASSGCVNVKAPPTANAAPPGYYMLFLLDSRGVPSVAKFVRLTSGGTASACPGSNPTDPDPGGGGDTGGSGGGTTGGGGGSTVVPPKATPPDTPSTPAAPATIRVRVSSAPATRGSSLRAVRRRVAIRCRASATTRTRSCRVTLRQRLRGKRTRVIGTATATLRPGRGEAKVSVVLTRTAARQLAASGSLRVWADLRVTVRGSRGSATARHAYRLID